jgi:hypothetical protein
VTAERLSPADPTLSSMRRNEMETTMKLTEGNLEGDSRSVLRNRRSDLPWVRMGTLRYDL